MEEQAVRAQARSRMFIYRRSVLKKSTASSSVERLVGLFYTHKKLNQLAKEHLLFRPWTNTWPKKSQKEAPVASEGNGRRPHPRF
jgi:hypothetical protein